MAEGFLGFPRFDCQNQNRELRFTPTNVELETYSPKGFEYLEGAESGRTRFDSVSGSIVPCQRDS